MTRTRAPKPWEEAYRLKGRLWGGDRLDEWTRDLIQAKRVPPPSEATPWLDVACGDGKGLVPLAHENGSRHVVGMDLVGHALRLARQRWHEVASPEAPVPPLLRADMRSLPVRRGAFGVIRAVHAVGHLHAADRVPAWRELARVLRAGGRLVVTEFGRGDLRDGHGMRVEPDTYVRAPGVSTRYYDEADLAEELGAAGLRCLEVRRVAHPFHVRGERAERVRIVALVVGDP